MPPSLASATPVQGQTVLNKVEKINVPDEDSLLTKQPPFGTTSGSPCSSPESR